MLQIIKQLEIIKSSILIEDVEIIELQIMKLNSQRFDEDVKNIYTVNITIYFQSIWYFHAPPVFYADPSGSH